MAHPCTLENCDCVSCSCKRYVCQNPCSTLARIQRRVRIPMTLYVARQSAFNISGFGVNSRGTDDNPNAVDSFSGPSDRAAPSFNTITGKRGVDKKHNSYARYLGRKKAPVLRADMQYGGNIGGCFGAMCCCICEQLITSLDTGNIDLQNVQVGDHVQDSTGATGVVIVVTHGGGVAGDLSSFVARVEDCKLHPFRNGGGQLIFSPPRGGIGVHTYTVITTNTCGGDAAPRRR